MIRLLAFLVLVPALFASLPEVKQCASQSEAQDLARAYCVALNAKVATKQGDSVSMAPLVGPRAIFLYVQDWRGLARGMVAIRRDAPVNVAHEVIAKVGDEFVMRGRANLVQDSHRLTSTNYVGTVVMILNYTK